MYPGTWTPNNYGNTLALYTRLPVSGGPTPPSDGSGMLLVYQAGGPPQAGNTYPTEAGLLAAVLALRAASINGPITIYGDPTFDGCTISLDWTGAGHMIWTSSPQDAVFESPVFQINDGAIIPEWPEIETGVVNLSTTSPIPRPPLVGDQPVVLLRDFAFLEASDAPFQNFRSGATVDLRDYASADAGLGVAPFDMVGFEASRYFVNLNDAAVLAFNGFTAGPGEVDFTIYAGSVTYTGIPDGTQQVIQAWYWTGITAARLNTNIASTGFPYFDTTLGIPIWRKGGGWCDATGAPV